jgi:hypothetical protein
VLQVDANARPGVEAPTHGVDQDVGGSEVGGGVGMASLPPFEPGERIVLPPRSRDLDQRMDRRPPAP